MIWSTYCHGKYVEACAISDNGEITGNWIHCNELVSCEDAGHGMLFHDKNQQLRFVMHAPNVTPLERPVIKYAKVVNGVIKISDENN